MTVYHLKNDGTVGVCHAKTNCPFGSNEIHFTSKEAARKAFENKQQVWDKRWSVPINLYGHLSFQKGSVFLELPNPEPMRDAYEYLASRVSEKTYKELVSRKNERDGADKFHITVVNYKDLKKLYKNPVMKPRVDEIFKKGYNFTLEGVGTAKNDEGQAWFAVVTSPELQEARNTLGLPPTDLHVTLGFVGKKDVYGVPKGFDTFI